MKKRFCPSSPKIQSKKNKDGEEIFEAVQSQKNQPKT